MSTVSAIVPSFGRPDRVVECVSALAAADPVPSGFEVVVVTCGYSRGLVDRIRSLGRPEVRVHFVVLDAPRPVSESRNIGAEAAQGEALLFVDDDNYLSPETPSLLVGALDSWSDADVVAPVMFFAESPDSIWCAGLSRTRFLMRTKWVRAIPPGAVRISSEDFPNCFMVRSREFSAVGGFDSSTFPEAYEEADLARRLHRCFGRQAFCVARASAWHHISAAPHRRYHLDSPVKAYRHARNRRLFIRLYGSRLQCALDGLVGRWLMLAAYTYAMRTAPRAIRRSLWEAYARGAIETLPRVEGEAAR